MNAIRFNITETEEEYANEILNKRKRQKENTYKRINEVIKKSEQLEVRYYKLKDIDETAKYFNMRIFVYIGNITNSLKTYMYTYKDGEKSREYNCNNILVHIILAERLLVEIKEEIVKSTEINEEMYEYIDYFYEVKKDIENLISKGIL